MDTTYLLARNVVDTKYENLPPAAVGVTKKQILDTIGTNLAGSTALGIKPLVELIKEWAGKEESTIFSYGGKVPAFHAAQANATMAHALDYDDTHSEGGHMHPSAVVVPTALAMAERQGRVSGKELITAVALGVDLACRMGLATISAKPHLLQGGWHFTPLFGYFSAAAVAGKLLRLDEEEMLNALGIGYHQAAGNMQCIADGAMTKRMGPGFAARGGITAALMAEKGITGSKNSLEAERGIYNLYHAGLEPTKLTGELGQRFEGVNISFKPYPCCRGNHYHIDVTLQLVFDNDIKPEEVDEITAILHPQANELLCSPLDVKRQPRNIVDSQFSLPWSLACAVVRRKVGLKEFTEESIKDPALLKMARKVIPAVDDSLPDMYAGQVNIKTKSRGIFSKREDAVLGSPRNPISMDALINKFRECATFGVKRLSGDNIDKMADMISNLEKVDDVSQLIQLVG